jgi:hypothetical protein
MTDSDIVDTSDWPDTEDIRGWVEWRTRNLRSGDPYWEPIAAQLRAHGLDPETTILADLWGDDPSMEAVVVVTPGGRVFEYDYRWPGESHSDGTFTLWRDLTASWRIDAYPSAAVAVALELVSEHGQRPMQAARQTNAHRLRAHVVHCTRRMRSGDLNWRDIPALLVERGIVLMRAAEGSIYSEREARAVYFIATAEGAVFQYNARWTSSTSWTLTEWKDVTNTSTLDEHEQDLIRVALEIAKAG